MEESAIRIGPFELLHPLGFGGMGEVWAATHTGSHLDVAIKVIAGEIAWSDRFRRAFRNEIRAVVSLDHPGIVAVLDTGEIPAEAASRSGGLIAGAPYLVTEYLGGGALSEWIRFPRQWPEVLGVALQLLDALGHAHARGVIHRDVKPNNVLFDARGQIRLTDFGIAQLHDSEGAIESFGTPSYIAPEQALGPRREISEILRLRAAIGPWTDLYGFGCTLWALVTGLPPFGDLHGEALRRAHLSEERPSLHPMIAVPSGLERILHRAIAAAPNARYQRAIELATELSALGGADRLGVVARPHSGETPSPTERVPAAFRTTSDLPLTEASLPSAPRAAPVPIPFPEEPAPELERTGRALRGVGLELFGLRPAPVVGRAEERQALWAALEGACRGEGPRAVLLRGPTGTGKTHLATWAGLQAHAVAGAEVWVAHHGPTDGGLSTLIGSWLGGKHGSLRSPDEVLAVLSVRLGALPPGEEIEPAVIGELVMPTGRIRFTQPEERYSVVCSLLWRIASERPVVLRIEDVQWGADALGLVGHLLDQGPPRLLMVLTARDEALAERPVESPKVRALLFHPRVSMIPIGPLGLADRRKLIHVLLPLEATLASQIADRTGGNPLFATQLLGDLVARGALEPDEVGFRLRPDPMLPGCHPVESADLDLGEVWAQRLDALLDGSHGAIGVSLELAAVLGLQVDGAEWRAVAELADLPAPTRLAERLIEAGLARSDGEPEGGFRFVHAMLREALLARAEDGQRLARHHAICAEILAGSSAPGSVERRGRHLLEAGAPGPAAGCLVRAAAERIGVGEYAAADEILELWEAAMSRAGAPVRDPAWGQGWRTRYELAYHRGDFDAADTWAERVLDHARWHGWPDLECRALLDRANLLNIRGAREEAAKLIARASELPAANEPSLAARCRLWDGVMSSGRGDYSRARVAFAEARAGFERLGDAIEAANAARSQARAALLADDPRSAIEAADRARSLFESIGHLTGMASVDNTLADAWRALGELALAEKGYRAARDGMRRLGMSRVLVPETNLAIVLLDQGRAGEARDLLERISEEPGARLRPPFHASIQALLVAAAALESDWSSFDRTIEAARKAIEAGGYSEPDTHRALQRALTVAWAAGEDERASRVAALMEREAPVGRGLVSSAGDP